MVLLPPGRSVHRAAALSVFSLILLLAACAGGAASPPANQAAAPQAASAQAAAPAQAPAVTGAPDATTPPDRIPVKIGYSSLTDNNLGLWVAKEAGLFEEQGLELTDFPLIEGGTLTIQALLGGDTQFVLAGTSGIIVADLGGADLVGVAGTSNKFDFALLTVPEVHSGADLRGKRVGISRFGSSSDFAARSALQYLGLDPDRDVTILQIGGTAARVGAMQSGSIEAAPEIAPALLTARKLGFNMLVDLAQIGVPYQVGPIATTRTLINENPELARRVVRGYLAGIHRMKTDKAFSMSVSSKYMQIDDPEALSESWEHFAQGSIPEVPYITDDGILPVLKELADSNPAAMSATPSQFYDNRFLKEAEDSGFVNRLYGR
ncbi:MAG TPA: ABC transporter substrate-binding protein [Chloroflexota bacterium]|nr:ABC transporter substrate-binding protein [Chloroflexota bacterium]